MSPLRIIELIILAALAGVVLFQLYAVLGRRVGRGAEDLPAAPLGPVDALRPTPAVIDGPVGGNALSALRSRDPSFDPTGFLNGARRAYQMIVSAFAAGDRAALRPLLSESVMASFETAITQRQAESRSETVEFLHEPRADLDEVRLIGDTASVSVRFLSEYRSRSQGPEGEAVDDRRTAEIWTFQRNLKSRDPNWLLIHVDAAEA